MFNIGNIIGVIKKVSHETMTSSAGEYDPARVFGYGFMVLAALFFLGMSVYDTVKNGKFNISEYTNGVLLLAGGFTAVAGGVALKKGAETPPPPPPPQ